MQARLSFDEIRFNLSVQKQIFAHVLFNHKLTATRFKISLHFAVERIQTI